MVWILDKIEYKFPLPIDYNSTDFKCFVSVLNKIRAKYKLKPQSEYDVYEQMLIYIENNTPIDLLRNKIIISPVIFLINTIKYNINNIQLLRSCMEKGTMFIAISKNIYLEKPSYIHSNDKTLYEPISGSKQDNGYLKLALIKRKTTIIAFKSNSLFFFDDAKHFICPITSKELVNAGELMEFAQFTFTSLPISVDKIYNYLDGIKNEIDSKELYTIIVGDFMTHYKLTFEQFYELKKKFLMITGVLYKYDDKKYIKLNYIGLVAIKLSIKYNVFLSPGEISDFGFFFKDPFDTYTYRAQCGYHTHQIYDLLNLEAAKINVSRNNQSGKCAKTTNKLNIKMFKSAAGDQCILTNSDEMLIEPKIISKSEENILIYNDLKQKAINVYKNRFPNKSTDHLFKKNYNYNLNILNELFVKDSYIKDVENFLDILAKQLDIKYTLKIEHGKSKSDNFKLFKGNLKICNIAKKEKDEKSKIKYIIKNIENNNFYHYIYKYKNFVNNNNSENKFNQFHMFAYITYGDIGGGTVEDGLVMDKHFYETCPIKKLISFSSKILINYADNGNIPTIKKFEASEIQYLPKNEKKDNSIIFGILTSIKPLNFQKNDKINIYKVDLSTNYVYTIYRYFDSDAEIKEIISYRKNSFIFTQIIMEKKIGIGTKIANLFGQKNIVSKIEDLSPYACYLSDGRKIVPQFLYSITSIVGRTTITQLSSGMEINSTGFQKIGDKVALVNLQPLIIHYIEPISKFGYYVLKNDIWTCQFGLISNECINVAKYNFETKNNINIYKTMLAMKGNILNLCTKQDRTYEENNNENLMVNVFEDTKKRKRDEKDYILKKIKYDDEKSDEENISDEESDQMEELNDEFNDDENDELNDLENDID